MVRKLLRVWAGIGLQSFGGGASTQLLIRQAFVEKRDWLSPEELSRFWSLCQFTPGINLISLTVLIGRKLGGTRGIVASLTGMLLPSAAVTCLLAAGFQAVQHSPAVHAVLRGVVPATAGIMGLVAMNYARPLLEPAEDRRLRTLLLSVAFILGSTLAIALFKVSVIVVVVAVAVLGTGVFTLWQALPEEEASPGSASEGMSR